MRDWSPQNRVLYSKSGDEGREGRGREGRGRGEGEDEGKGKGGNRRKGEGGEGEGKRWRREKGWRYACNTESSQKNECPVLQSTNSILLTVKGG